MSRGGRKSRQVNVRNERPSTCLIITEGTETEVHYFENIKQLINTRFRNREIQENYPIKVEGLARSTTVLVREAIKRKNRENFSEVWVVFDKDDNPDFDEAITLAKSNDINVAWSNESFELWLLLHFQDLNVAIPRTQYLTRLTNHFKINNINNGLYSKNIPNIFNAILNNVDLAISRSETLQNYYCTKNIISPSKMNPCTVVDHLVKRLIPYIK